MVFNVLDFGALGDGTTDDTAAVQTAIAAAQATPVGGVVYFPTGTYRLTAELSVNPRRVALQGDGPQCTYLAPELIAGQYALTLGWDNNIEPGTEWGPYAAVEGLSLRGQTGPGQPNGIRLFNASSNGRAHSMSIREVGIYGFDVQVDLGNSVYLVRFDRVFFTAAQSLAVRMDDVVGAGENISFASCVFSGVPGTAVYLNKSGASFVFTACSFDYCKRAAWQRAGQMAFIGCHFETDTRFGPGGEYLLLARRGFVNRPMMSLTDCEFYDAWDNYDCAIRLAGDNGDNGLRLVNPYVRTSSTMCPYLIRDEGVGYRSTVLVSGAWYGQGSPTPKLRRRDGTDLVLAPVVVHTLT